MSIVRLSGSFARGEQHAESDLDFAIKEESPVAKVRNIDKIKTLLAKYNLKWKSCMTDTISTENLSPMLEFSIHFPRYKQGVKKVFGIEFKT
jgi:predicted nucleotidyltransferase